MIYCLKTLDALGHVINITDNVSLDVYYIYVFYVLGIKPNAWTYISDIKLKS
jgi:hypothetical protein